MRCKNSGNVYFWLGSKKATQKSVTDYRNLSKTIRKTSNSRCAAKGRVEERILPPIRNLDSTQDSNVGTLETLQNTIGPHWRRRCRQMLAGHLAGGTWFQVTVVGNH